MVAHIPKHLRLQDDKPVYHDSTDNQQRQDDNNRIMKYEGDIYYDLEGNLELHNVSRSGEECLVLSFTVCFAAVTPLLRLLCAPVDVHGLCPGSGCPPKQRPAISPAGLSQRR